MQSEPLPTPAITVAEAPPHSDASIPCPQPQPQFNVIPPPVNGALQMPYPNTGSQPWMPEQLVYPNPIGFPPWLQQAVASYSIPNVMQPVADTNQLQYANSNPTQTTYWPYPFLQTPQNNSRKRKPKPNQNVRCEICDVFCNSLELYEKHLSGKKHLKSLKRNYPSQTTPSQPTPLPVVIDSTPEKNSTTCYVSCSSDKSLEDNVAAHKEGDQDILTATVSDHGKDEAPLMKVDEGLGAKNQKLQACEVIEESVLLGSADNASCGNSVASADHLSEEKHDIQDILTATLSDDGTNEAPSMSVDEVLDAKKRKLPEGKVFEESLSLCSTDNAPYGNNAPSADHLPEEKHNMQVGTTSTETPIVSPNEDFVTKKQKFMQGGDSASSVRICTICNIECNSEVVFADHILGRKHIALVKKSGAVDNVNQPAPLPGNLDSKRKKAKPRICTLCNVACNSDAVFSSHLAGQKHASVVKRMGLTEVQPHPASIGQ